MKCNIGCFERNLRIVVGSVLVTLAYTHQLTSWAWIGFLPLVTGIIKYCPLYTIIKRNGCSKSQDSGGCCK